MDVIQVIKERRSINFFDAGREISDDKIIPMLITIGYLRPGITLLPRAFRRSIKEFVKFENY